MTRTRPTTDQASSGPAGMLPRVCVIGAGSSGLAATKALKDAGIPFDTFELSDRVGGLWVYENPNGMAAAYRGLNSNTPKRLMEYAEYPMPGDISDYPSHWEFARYFQGYAERFGLLEHIRFQTGVEHVVRREDGVFAVSLSDGSSQLYDCVLVANGHHWNPKLPDPPFPGQFEGTEMHSHEYREPTFATGKRVIVLGMGNSAMDIAVEASYTAERTFIAARRGAHILPKYIAGRTPSPKMIGMLSNKPGRLLMGAISLLSEGSPERVGLPKPDHAFGEAHPSVQRGLYDRVRDDRIVPKPNIAELLGDRVRFADDSVEHADLIIYCTGYRITFPFFDEDYISTTDNQISLYRRVVHPDRPGVFFIGLCQPIGAIQPIAEAQSKWVAEILLGNCALPSPEAMRREITRDQKQLRNRYVASTRHTIQIDHGRYLRELRQERRDGVKRAAAHGHRPTIPSRVSRLEGDTP